MKAKIITNFGDIIIELDEKKAPITVKNFEKYVKNKLYDDTIFHRVIKNFMIQGGGMEKNGKEKETFPPIENEAYNNLKNKRGTIAMARTNEPHSATNQFFINLVDNYFLDFKSKNSDEYGYAVFGKVIEGMDVVDSISNLKTKTRGYHEDWPIENVIIKTIEMF